jgi:hypothetical protein
MYFKIRNKLYILSYIKKIEFKYIKFWNGNILNRTMIHIPFLQIDIF